MAIILYNPNQSDYELHDLGITVLGQGTYDLSNKTRDQVERSFDLKIAVTNGNLKVQDTPGVYFLPSVALDIVSGNESPVNGITILTKFQFWSRFTFAERVALEASTSPYVRVVAKSVELADYVDLNHPELGPSLDILISEGILTSSRKAEIMSY